MSNKLEDFVRLPYSIEVTIGQTTEGLPCYVACHPELPGCMSHGDTAEEAIANLSEARELYIKTLLEKGLEVPLPKSSAVAIWEVTALKMETPAEGLYYFPAEVTPIESLELNKEGIEIV